MIVCNNYTTLAPVFIDFECIMLVFGGVENDGNDEDEDDFDVEDSLNCLRSFATITQHLHPSL